MSLLQIFIIKNRYFFDELKKSLLQIIIIIIIKNRYFKPFKGLNYDIEEKLKTHSYIHTHAYIYTHTHTYIHLSKLYIYIYINNLFIQISMRTYHLYNFFWFLYNEGGEGKGGVWTIDMRHYKEFY